MSGWTIEWSHGQANVQVLGGMLGPVWFQMPDGRIVQPFAVFPWTNEGTPPGERPLTGLMAGGCGEWPCVPFGVGTAVADSEWRPPIHGESAHHAWVRVDDGRDPSCLALRFRCGAAGPIEMLERQIAGVPGAAAIQCKLTVHVRWPCLLPIGLHPTLRVPARPRSLSLLPGDFEFAMTYPREVESGADLLVSGTVFSDLSSVPARNGGAVDLTAYPLREATESIVQLCGIEGRVDVVNQDERYRLSITWPSAQLPSCVLWISNGGRRSWPWNGRHFALGVEPVCAAFDLGMAASNEGNSISERGVATTMKLRPDAPTTIEYSVAVADVATSEVN
ncbi:hypothetical protein X994_6546 (plasmid) [Burkholderia pseudomallei]|uniref:Aldose 1-epimerase n=1 Tax=Burkholderia pseudomallei TaxID=28450 RepID=A0AA40MFD5_BURPE|nr:hypothetical protein [Burkholderia pseudomallei]AIV73849.1 hypothetical protein X994_6546 [Burkholderia pseudomallei]KGS72505.1 hypothetical protein X942_6146 [Burkholderia pseudomallei MSHR5596]KGW78511.1 hypothetical protein Y046_4886 [Burkholderia pseudomallei MSHR2990]KGX17113.1 hypothetical protein Y036_6111 [Burkholderia pseudomallei]